MEWYNYDKVVLSFSVACDITTIYNDWLNLLGDIVLDRLFSGEFSLSSSQGRIPPPRMIV